MTHQTFEKKELKKKSVDISGWYNDVILKAELADYAPVKGTMVIRPYGYALWERIQEIFNRMIKKSGVENAYFPLFIPKSFLEKEKAHVEGFSPELAIVTIGGGEKLSEPLVVRPTSETIMYAMYAKWIKSWRDLPVLMNQWNNVVRWEKRTYLFLRTTEFLWQEGHTAHSTHEEAISFAQKAHDWYRQVFEDYLAIPVMLGTKSVNEKFAGAVTTYTVEALMPDGKALQSATSHDLGQNFSQVFDIAFSDSNGQRSLVWQTSWGLSTRALGGLFLTHGDDAGIVLPPRMAPISTVIVPIYRKDVPPESVRSYAEELKMELSEKYPNLTIRVDLDDTESPGRKFNRYEVKGVPIRVEIGNQEATSQTVTAAFRDTGEKVTMAKTQFIDTLQTLLDQMQQRLFEKQKTFLETHTFTVDSYDRFCEIMKTTRGFIFALWCEDPECEKKIKEDTKATTRCLPLHSTQEEGTCIRCGRQAFRRWCFAQSY